MKLKYGPVKKVVIAGGDGDADVLFLQSLRSMYVLQ
jgi:hypothetical protein